MKRMKLSRNQIIVIGLVVLALVFGVGALPHHLVGPPSLTEGVTFHVEGIKFDYTYTGQNVGAAGINRYWNYGSMNNKYFHVTQPLPNDFSKRSLTESGCSINPDASDDGLPTLNIEVGYIGVTDSAVDWIQTYDINQRLIDSGAVIRRYTFYIKIWTNSEKPTGILTSGAYELDGTWRETRLYLHFWTQRWNDAIYAQFGSTDLVGNFTTFLDVRCVEADITQYTGGGKTGDWTLTKHEWSPIEGQAFSIYSLPDVGVEPTQSVMLQGEQVAKNQNRVTITPVDEIVVPLVIRNLGGYYQVSGFTEEYGDPLITLKCEAVVLSNYNYLAQEGPPQEPNVPEDIWAYAKKFIDFLMGNLLLVVIILGVIFLIPFVTGGKD